jgi:hypothetical protein
MYTHHEEENAATINYLKNLQKVVLVHNTRSESIINRVVYSLFYFFTFCKYLDTLSALDNFTRHSSKEKQKNVYDLQACRLYQFNIKPSSLSYCLGLNLREALQKFNNEHKFLDKKVGLYN